MFSPRLDYLEDSFVGFLEKQQQVGKDLTATLNNLRAEIHTTNSQIAQFNSNQELKLLETKAEIYNNVFSKVVVKTEYEREKELLEEAFTEIRNDLDKKVDKSTVKVTWILFTSIAAGFAWFQGKT